jgi:hypothetical protein
MRADKQGTGLFLLLASAPDITKTDYHSHSFFSDRACLAKLEKEKKQSALRLQTPLFSP